MTRPMLEAAAVTITRKPVAEISMSLPAPRLPALSLALESVGLRYMICDHIRFDYDKDAAAPPSMEIEKRGGKNGRETENPLKRADREIAPSGESP